MSIERVLKVLRQRAWLIALCFLLAIAAAAAFSATRTKKYTASASVLFKNPAIAQQAANVPIVNQNDPQGQRDTNLRLLQRPTVAARAAGALRLTPAQVKGAVSVSAQGQSNVMTVAATSTSPEQSARIANAYAAAFVALQRDSDQASIQSGIELVRQQYLRLTPQQQAGAEGLALKDRLESLRIFKAMQNNTQVAQQASVPGSPSSPKVARNVALAAFLGLLLGVGAAFLLERLDRRLRDPREIEETLGVPMLGVIPHGGRAGSAADAPAAIDLEPFRMLRANLRYFNVDRRLRTVLVASAAPGEGKSTVSCNLARAAASMGTRVLLVECDLRRPTVAKVLGLRSGPGLADALVGTRDELPAAVQHVDVEGRTNGAASGQRLDVLVAGGMPPNPAQMLESQAMERLMAWAVEHYELVIIDTPPIAAVPDAIPLMERVDGVIVVSRVGQSTRDATEHFMRRLNRLGAPTVGVVANDLRGKGSSGYGYDYTYEAGGERRRPAAAPVAVQRSEAPEPEYATE